MLLLALLALVAGVVAVVRTPRLARLLAVPIVLASTLMVVVHPTAIVALSAAIVVTVTASAALTDARYLLSRLVPMPMTSTFGIVNADGSTSRRHASWVQWHGRVMRHREHALA